MPIQYGSLEKPYELFQKGKREGTWDPDDYDLAQDREDWTEFTDEQQQRFLATTSGFYDGEEDVTRTLAPYMMALEAIDPDDAPFDVVQQQMYLAQQVYEEAKHTDFFARYYEEVFGTQDTAPYREGGYQESGYSTDDLYETADELSAKAAAGYQREIRFALGEAYLNYMGIVEAQLARGGYLSFDQMAESKAAELGRDAVLPGFQAGVGKVRQDETRHIENGRWVLAKLADHDRAIVPEVYEPRIAEYVENRILPGPMYPDNPFEGYDQKAIGKRVVQYLQDTIDYVGAERFDRFGDVRAAIGEMREQAAADD